MGDPGFDVDALARSLAPRGGTRRALVAALAGAAALAPVLSLHADAKRKKKKKKRCKFSPKCDGECCSPDRCFAKEVDGDTNAPLSFGCCPAGKLCSRIQKDRPDQCCYPDEYCDPGLVDRFGDLAPTICCRPCNGGCCIELAQECINGECVQVDTARLPRVRR